MSIRGNRTNIIVDYLFIARWVLDSSIAMLITSLCQILTALIGLISCSKIG